MDVWVGSVPLSSTPNDASDIVVRSRVFKDLRAHDSKYHLEGTGCSNISSYTDWGLGHIIKKGIC